MIHHISIGVSDIIASGSFYDAILEPLGYTRVFEDLRPGERHQAIGYGVVPSEDIFTIKKRNSEFLSPGLVFILPSLRHHVRRLRCGTGEELKRVRLTKVGLKFGQTLDSITMQLT